MVFAKVGVVYMRGKNIGIIVLGLVIFISLFLSVFSNFAYSVAESIYIHPNEYEWYHSSHSFLCTPVDCSSLTGDFRDDEEGFCCGTLWCEAGTEGTYKFTYVVDSHDDVPTEEKKITTPWSSVNFDTQEWACLQCGRAEPYFSVWDPEAPSNNRCCGDDANDDPDDGELSCTGCPNGLNWNDPGVRHWNSEVNSNACCGDDTSDCRDLRSGNSYLCSDIPDDHEGNPIWDWNDANDNTGNIWDTRCNFDNQPGAAYLADGGEWIICSNEAEGDRFDVLLQGASEGVVQNPYPNLEHDYICYQQLDGVETVNFNIAECCGPLEGGTCDNSGELGGGEFYSGFSAEFYGVPDRTFFCTEDYTFSEDLDIYPEACNNAIFANGTSRGYLYTGTRCCAEPEDSPEYYNDIGGIGACFDSMPIENGHFVNNLTELTADNGQLTGCMINATIFKPDNQWLLDLEDFNGSQLIVDAPYCTVINDYSYCDYSEEWKETNGQNVSNLVFAPEDWNVTPPAGCCTATTCWNGSGCHENQASDPLSDPPMGDSYRCSEGAWIESELKKPLEDDIWGYCPRNDQCLVSIYGSYFDNDNPDANPMCIASGQNIGDNFCEGGYWSSKTKMVALTLLSVTNEDYTLYCGTNEDTLNYDSYLTETQYFVENLFDNEVLNNICVLRIGSEVIIGTSSNVDFEELPVNLGEIFSEFTDCEFSNATGFYSCDGEEFSSAWVNNDFKMIIYGSFPFILQNEIDFATIFDTSIVPVLFDDLLAYLKSDPDTEDFFIPDDFTLQGMKFDYLFMENTIDNNLFATLDEGNLLALYDEENLESVCSIINNYNIIKTGGGENTKMVCEEQDTKSYIITQGSIYADIDPFFIWNDLTGKLRTGGSYE